MGSGRVGSGRGLLKIVYCVKIIFSEHQYFGEKGAKFFSVKFPVL